MAVPTTINKVVYDENGVTTSFPFGFKVFDASHLLVTQIDPDSNETLLTQGVDYTVSGLSNEAGGSIAKSPAAVGYKLRIERMLPYTQTARFRNAGAFLPETHEQAFDTVVMMTQQIVEQLVRSVSVSKQDSEAGVSASLPTPLPGAALAWNAAGDGIGNLIGESSGTVEDARDLTLADLANTSDPAKGDALIAVKRGSVARTQHDINAETVSLADYSDLAAALSAGKGRVYVPAGTYDVAAPMSATLTAPCVLFGEGTFRYTGTSSTGNILSVDCGGYDFRIEGLTFDGQNLIAGGPKITNTTSMDSPIPDLVVRGCTFKSFKMNAPALYNSGAYILGSFETVEISGNTVKDITRATGTGTPGSSGTIGIFVGQTDATHYVKACRHFGNTYDTINGGDAVGSANNVDHDGFMFFTPDPSNFKNSDNTIFRYAPATVISCGNSYRNCRGRAIKVQGIAEVFDEKIIRDADYTNYGGSNEINLQWGVGTVRDCQFFYTDYSSGTASPIQTGLTLVNVYQGSSYGEAAGGAVIDGLTVYNAIKAGLGVNPTILGAYAGATVLAKNRPLITLRNVVANRGTIQHIVTITQSAGSYGLIRLDSISVEKVQYSAIGTGDVNTNVDIVATAVLHLDGISTPANVKPWVAVTGSSSTSTFAGALSGFGNKGWTETYASGGGRAFPVLAGGTLAAPNYKANNGGTASVQSVSLADAAISSLSLRGYTSGRGLAMISASYDFNTQAVIVMGDGKVAVVGAPGTHVFSPSTTVDTEVDGGAGKINLWMTSAGELKIRNRLGSTRQFTVLFFG